MEPFNVTELAEQLMAPIDLISDEIKKKWEEMQGPDEVWAQVKDFFSAIDWNQRWLQGVLATELLLLIAVIRFKKHQGVQCAAFILIGVIIMSAEAINARCRANWSSFATENYFDEHGLFVTTFLSGPLIFIMIFMLINFLAQTVSMMVRMKRAQLKSRARRVNKPAESSASTDVKKTR